MEIRAVICQQFHLHDAFHRGKKQHLERYDPLQWQSQKYGGPLHAAHQHLKHRELGHRPGHRHLRHSDKQNVQPPEIKQGLAKIES